MSKISKILYIITQSEIGGAQRYVCDLAVYLHNQNYNIIVCSGQDGPLLHSLEKKVIHTHIFKNLVREISPIKDIKGMWEIYKYIKKEKPHIVHLNSSKAGVLGSFAAKLAGIKHIIYTAHGFVFLEPQPYWKKIFYILAEKISSYCKDIIICVSDYDKNQAIKYFIAPSYKLVTIHNGINMDEMRILKKDEAIEEISKKLKIEVNNKKIIGTIANLYSTKGLEYFIQSAKKIREKFPDSIFLVIGEGEKRSFLKKEIEKNNLEKHFFLLGLMPQAHRYLLAFDVYVCSSLKEGLPYSIIEVMAAGIPIVSTNVGGIAEIIQSHWKLVEPKNSGSLSLEISNILLNKNNSETAIKAQEFIKTHFSLNVMVEKTKKNYGIIGDNS